MRQLDIFSNGYYKSNRIQLTILGLWPDLSIGRRITLQMLAILALISINLPQWAYLIRVCDNIDDSISSMSEHTVNFIGIVKFVCFAINIKQIKIVINSMQEDWSVLAKSIAVKTLRIYAKRGQLGTTLYMVIIYSLITIFSLMPWQPIILDMIMPLNESRPKSFALKTDHSIYGIDSNEQYIFIILHDFGGSAVITSYIVAVDTFIIIVVEHCCGLFAAVGNVLQQIERDLSPKQQYKVVCEAVIIHHRAISLAASIDSIFTIMYGLVVLMNMVALSTGALGLVLHKDRTSDAPRFMAFVVSLICHLFFLSVPGQQLTDHSSRVSQGIYDSSWCGISLETRKMISMMLLGSRKSAYLTAGNFYILSYENIATVLKTSFSFLTVMLSTR